MATLTHDHHDDHHDHDHGPVIPYEVELRSNRVGLWLFCVSELFLFVGMFAARLYLWRAPEGVSLPKGINPGDLLRPDLSQSVGLITTCVLLVSSYFMVRAEVAVANGHKGKFRSSLWITFFLGLIFLLGVVVVEWGTIPSLATAITGHEHHIKPQDGVIGAVLFLMTGFHAFHVLTGLIFILILLRNDRKGWYTEDRHWGVEACAIYWHYVDVIWIFFYPALYLIGKTYPIVSAAH